MTAQVHTETGPNYLESRVDLKSIGQLLLPIDAWRQYPDREARTAWEGVPKHLREPILQNAEALLNWKWPHIPATIFLEYSRIGNRINYEELHFERRRNLITFVLAECLEGEGRFLDQIIDGVWALCEETYWGVPAHNRPRFYAGSGLPDNVDHYVDLFAAETGNLLAWTHYLLRTAISAELPIVLNRIECELQDRILGPYRERDDWAWLGLVEHHNRHPNNWNPWIHSNVLAANLLIEQDADVRNATVVKCIEGVDRFLAGYAADGGCDEGISYWGRAGASLFDFLDLLDSASEGKINVYGESLIGEIGRYVYRMHIGEQWFVNFADGTAKVDLDAALVYRYGLRIGDDRMVALGVEGRKFVDVLPPRIATLGRGLGILFEPVPLEQPTATQSFLRDVWLPGVEVLASHQRDDTDEGLFLAAKGGHNGESHNHNDIGSFIVGLDGRPVIIDVGVETYSRKTFSPERYDIWTMQSAHHNLPTINGKDQLPGADYGANLVESSVSDAESSLVMDIAGSYGRDAKVHSWMRRSTIDRTSSKVNVVDEFELSASTADLIWNLMTAEPVEEAGPGELIASHQGRRLRIRYDASLLEPSFERIAITDGRLRPVWNEEVWRTRFRLRNPLQSGTISMEFGRA
ncbi:MAG: heparinase II/III family protein [Thermomicrobiales bacterium]